MATWQLCGGGAADASTDDPAGIQGRLAAHTAGRTADVAADEGGPRASLRLLAALLSPLAAPCALPPSAVEKCVHGGRVSAKAAYALSASIALVAERAPLPSERTSADALHRSLWQCLLKARTHNASAPPPSASRAAHVRPPSWCWREACARGHAVESWLRIHNYDSPLTQRTYNLEKAGEPVEDLHALPFLDT